MWNSHLSAQAKRPLDVRVAPVALLENIFQGGRDETQFRILTRGLGVGFSSCIVLTFSNSPRISECHEVGSYDVLEVENVGSYECRNLA